MCSCANGTINTVRHSPVKVQEYKKAYIVSAENSQFISFKPGIFIFPGAYIILPDDPSEKIDVVGNTDRVIQKELEKYGISSVIGKRGDILDNEYDLIVEYHDTWRWDFKKILDKLEIVFISNDGNMISKSTYNISKNKEIHNFPTPEKEVPKMIKQMLENN